MAGMQRDLDKPLRLHPLTYLDEGDEVTVGRADIDSYGLFPSDGAALVRQLEAGRCPNEAGRWYFEQYAEQVDIGEFLDVLDDLDLLVGQNEEVATVGQVGWQRLGRALFSPVAWCIYALLVGGAVVATINDRALAPSYRHLFFTNSSLTLLTLGIVLGQLPWMLLHEAFHALAGRRLGLNSKLGIGRRFYYVVFVTSLDGLVAVPRRKRYLPMLAGMLLDVLAISVLTLGAAALRMTGGFGALAYKYLLCMAFGVVLRLAWQFYFFLRTDLYFLAITVLGCNDLQTVSRQLLGNRVKAILGRRRLAIDESTWTPRDREVARWYAWLMVAGYAFLMVLLVTVMLPAAVRITRIVVHNFGKHPSVLNGLDLVAFLILNFSDFMIAGFLAVRSYRAQRRPAAPAVARLAEAATDVVSATGTALDAVSAGDAATDVVPAGDAAADVVPAGDAAADVVPAGDAAADVVPAGGSAPDLVSAGGRAPDVVSAGGRAPDVVPAGGSAPDVVPAGAMAAAEVVSAAEVAGPGRATANAGSALPTPVPAS